MDTKLLASHVDLTWKPEEGIRLGGHADTDETALGLVVYLGLPVVDVILFRYR